MLEVGTTAGGYEMARAGSGVIRTSVKTMDRQTKAVECRRAGWGYQQIADKLGYAHPSGARKAVLSALRRALEEPAEAVRALELSRLDRLQMAIWDAAVAGDVKRIKMVLDIMARRAQLLGLDAPVMVDIEQRVRDMAVAEGLDPDEAVEIARDIIKKNHW